jgi:hypothetical protein
LEQPAAMRTITSRCLGVIDGTLSTVEFVMTRGYGGCFDRTIARQV